MSRSIATRLMDASAIEAEACFGADARLKSLYSDGRMWRIHRRPLMYGEAATIPACALYIYTMPHQFLTSVGQGGSSEVDYVLTHQFVMDAKALDYPLGERSWVDDPLVLMHWYYTGGAHPNIPGNIFDPDNAGRFLSNSLKGYQFMRSEAFPNQNVVIEVDVTWQVVEDSQGNKI